MSLTLAQTDRNELLDLGRGSFKDVEASLHDIRRINRYLGGARNVVAAVIKLLQQQGLRAATVLDVGTGGGDIPLRLVSEASRRGIRVEVIAADLSYRHLQVARHATQAEPAVHLLECNAFSLPIPDDGVDIVMASLFLHHFRPPGVSAILNECSRVSRGGWVFCDLVRHLLPLAFFRLSRPVFARSYLTRHDGEVSLRRSYTVAEMREVLQSAGFAGTRLESRFPYRMCATWAKQRKP